MDRIIKEHQNSTKMKYYVPSGNNSALIKKLIENYNGWEEQSNDDEKYAVQVSNFIWR